MSHDRDPSPLGQNYSQNDTAVAITALFIVFVAWAVPRLLLKQCWLPLIMMDWNNVLLLLPLLQQEYYFSKIKSRK
jgi:hypothetical protein